MATRTSGPRRRVRATQDSVLIHDIRNLGLRLSLLLSNMEEHYGDPGLQAQRGGPPRNRPSRSSTASRGAGRLAADAVLIKVPLDLNDLMQEVAADVPAPRAGFRAAGSASFAEIRRDLGRPPLPPGGDPERGPERAGGRGELGDGAHGPASGAARATSRSSRSRTTDPECPPRSCSGRLFRPFQTTKPGGVGPRPLHGAPHPAPPPGRRRGEKRGRRGNARPSPPAAPCRARPASLDVDSGGKGTWRDARRRGGRPAPARPARLGAEGEIRGSRAPATPARG